MSKRSPKSITALASTNAAIIVGQDGELYAWNENGGEEPLTSTGVRTGALVADLRLATGSQDGEIRHLKGYTTARDGGEGDFQWNATGTATDDGGTILHAAGFGFAHTGYWQRIYSGALDARWFGAVGDNSTNCTTPIANWLSAATRLGRSCWLPGGTYLTDPINLAIGAHIKGDGQFKSILKSRTGNHVIETTGTFVYGITLQDLGIEGKGIADPGGGHGIYFHDTGAFAPQGLRIKNVRVQNCSGHGIYLKQEWGTTLEHVETDMTGGNGFDLQGGNSTTLIACYPHQVATGKAGYRIHGTAQMISCNGIDNGLAYTVDWAVFGDDVGDGDASNVYSRAVMTNCNVEDFSRYGVRVKNGSQLAINGGQFQAPAAGSVVPIRVEGGAAPCILFGNIQFGTLGATYPHSVPIELGSGTVPPAICLNGTDASETALQFYATALASSYKVPTITAHYFGDFAGAYHYGHGLSGSLNVADEVFIEGGTSYTWSTTFQTTDATPTNQAIVGMPTGKKGTYDVTAWASGVNTATGATVTLCRRTVVEVDTTGSLTTRVNSETLGTDYDGITIGGFVVQKAGSGPPDNIEATVTGKGATTIKWSIKATIKVHLE